MPTDLIPTVLISDLFGPVSGGDGPDLVGKLAQAVPGVAAGVDDGLVAGEDQSVEEVMPEELPQIFDRVEFRAVGRQRQQREVVGDAQGLGAVSARLVEDDDRVAVGGDVLADLGQMQAHGFGVDGGQYERGGGTAARADLRTTPFGILRRSRMLRPRP